MARTTWSFPGSFPGLSALVVIAALATPGPALARDESDAPRVTARSFAPIPPGFAFDVEPRDDSDANLQLRDIFRDELAARAYPAVAGGPLRLRFTTDRIVPMSPMATASPGSDDRSVYDDDLRGGLPRDLFASPTRSSRLGAVAYRLRASVETRSGTVLWQGEASASAAHADERRLGRELAAVLVAELGHTIDPKVLGGVGGP